MGFWNCSNFLFTFTIDDRSGTELKLEGKIDIAENTINEIINQLWELIRIEIKIVEKK
jgi:hypothetical protein